MAITAATIQSDGPMMAASAIASSRAGNGHHQVGEPHQAGADDAAEIAGHDAEHGADQHRRAVGQQPDEERIARRR